MFALEVAMLVSVIVAAAALALLALVHSVLGEKEILQPLFRAEWSMPAPRWAMERILRFAWHLTSIAWLGLGAVALGLSIHLVIAAVGLVSAAIVFASLRGHLAWPLFALAGLAGLSAEGWLERPVLGVAVVGTLASVIAVAGLHLYWVAGGSWGNKVVIPTTEDGQPVFQPPRWVTGIVVGALAVFGALIAWVWTGDAPAWSRALLGLGCVVMTLRALGDGKRIGFSKQFRDSHFAVWDDRLFTPLAVLMAFGSGAALLA